MSKKFVAGLMLAVAGYMSGVMYLMYTDSKRESIYMREGRAARNY